MNEIIRFLHHGTPVFGYEHLMGKHRDHCLCFQCEKFVFDREKNCRIANLLYAVDLQCGITTPVFYCAEFIKGENKIDLDKK